MTIVCTDPRQRTRLLGILARTPDIEVASWADSPDSLTVEESGNAAVVVCAPPEGRAPADDPPLPRPRLADRQREVLVAYGASRDRLPVVARRLGMEQQTLKTHLRRVRAKYRAVGRPAPSRRDLYMRAVEDGLLPPQS